MFRCVSPIKSNTRNFISNSSFINMNKEGDLSQNINFGLGLNESNGFRKVNKNIFNDFPSDINSVLSTHNFFDKKLGLGGWPNLN